ncbi:HFL049Wp [Eremothecium sinecaudum]|uniref:HFL049Wp n=1 Tax=Eremothecium sinecaudum TaxID=45286 RepID=A0A0X8HUQ4_9SACH|nr:HFL049Wp [Eremothecium sinecaudum]AMD21807.1 HFL049Wp [Eremothecium sinecaudum]
MVLINGLKYACERCIRGHRVTTCNHTDQPLMMIKPKGRPSTTCAHCKELRRNKNTHASGVCTCGREEKRRLLKQAKDGTRSKTKDDKCKCSDSELCVCHKNRQNKTSLKRKNDDNGIIEPDFTEGSSYGSDFLEMKSKQENNNEQNRSPVINNASNNNDGINGDDSFAPLKSSLYMQDVMHLGLDPVQNMKPITPFTRTQVGEVSIPLNEYISAAVDNSVQSATPLLNLYDRILLQDANGGNKEKMSFFTDTSKTELNYNDLKKRQQRISSEHNTIQDHNDLNINYMASSNYLHSNSSRELANSDVPSVASDPMPKKLNSSDSISSLLNSSNVDKSNSHFYQDMLHCSLNQKKRFSQSPSLYSMDYTSSNGLSSNNSRPADTISNIPNPSGYSGNNTQFSSIALDNSVKQPAVNTLSLTPSFLDLPDGNYEVPYHQSFSIHGSKSNSTDRFRQQVPYAEQKAQSRQRSISIHKNHRYSQCPMDGPIPLTESPVDSSTTVNNVDPGELSAFETSNNMLSFNPPFYVSNSTDMGGQKTGSDTTILMMGNGSSNSVVNGNSSNYRATIGLGATMDGAATSYTITSSDEDISQFIADQGGSSKTQSNFPTSGWKRNVVGPSAASAIEDNGQQKDNIEAAKKSPLDIRSKNSLLAFNDDEYVDLESLIGNL